LAFHEPIFKVSDFEASVFGEMAFQGLGIPEKGFWKIEFRSQARRSKGAIKAVSK